LLSDKSWLWILKVISYAICNFAITNFSFPSKGIKLGLVIESLDHISIDGKDSSSSSRNSSLGQLQSATTINWKKATGSSSPIQFTGGSVQSRNDSLFRSDFDFSKMGIGGLGEEFQTIFRRAFAPRIFPGLVKVKAF
jgi:vesicle-fusing ATPase